MAVREGGREGGREGRYLHWQTRKECSFLELQVDLSVVSGALREDHDLRPA